MNPLDISEDLEDTKDMETNETEKALTVGAGAEASAVTIPAESLPKLINRVGQLARRAAKLGIAPLHLTTSDPYAKEFERNGKKEYYEAVDVTLHGESPKLAGWRLVAVLDHDTPDHKTMLLRVPDDTTAFPTGSGELEARGPWCDHCSTSRRRLETFVVAHDDGSLKVVGRQCVADFLGGVSPEALLSWASWVAELTGELDEYGSSGGGRLLLPTDMFLVRVAQSIRTDGWTSRTKAREFGYTATADRALYLAAPPRGADPVPDPEKIDVDVATAALAWARELPEGTSDEYLDKLGRVARWDAAPMKYLGILASTISAHARFESRELARKNTKPSFHVGEIKKRFKGLAVNVTGLQYGEGDYGSWTLVSFVTPDGAKLGWFASGGAARGIKAGQDLVIDGTPKKHDEYNGVKRTMLTRVKAYDAPAVAGASVDGAEIPDATVEV